MEIARSTVLWMSVDVGEKRTYYIFSAEGQTIEESSEKEAACFPFGFFLEPEN
jgi:hypothetical protein